MIGKEVGKPWMKSIQWGGVYFFPLRLLDFLLVWAGNTVFSAHAFRKRLVFLYAEILQMDCDDIKLKFKKVPSLFLKSVKAKDFKNKPPER